MELRERKAALRGVVGMSVWGAGGGGADCQAGGGEGEGVHVWVCAHVHASLLRECSHLRRLSAIKESSSCPDSLARARSLSLLLEYLHAASELSGKPHPRTTKNSKTASQGARGQGAAAVAAAGDSPLPP